MRKSLAFIISLGVLTACQGALGPDRGDPAQYALPGVRYACSGWSPEEPNTRLGLFDVSFPPTEFQGLNSTKGGLPPSDEQRQVILALGGTIVYQFQVPIIRAIFPIDNVPRLFSSRSVQPNYLAGMSDPADHDIDAAIGYTRAITADDTAYLRGLGVRVQHVLTSIHSVHALVPDSAVGLLRARAEIQYIEANGVVCLIS